MRNKRIIKMFSTLSNVFHSQEEKNIINSNHADNLLAYSPGSGNECRNLHWSPNLQLSLVFQKWQTVGPRGPGGPPCGDRLRGLRE